MSAILAPASFNHPIPCAQSASISPAMPSRRYSFGMPIVKGLKIGIPKEYRRDGMAGEIEALWAQGIGWLKEAGAKIADISLPHTRFALPAYYIVAPAEASSNLARYD